ncbi:MAG: hypothetical protein NUV61_03045 [Candidatus Azambacteria bacterium]|nr:hypothetical protein [Candidatus Azambacteria bacterium]
MKLYAVIESERGSRTGKGGDKILSIDLTAGNANNHIANIEFERIDDEWELRVIMMHPQEKFFAKGKL